MTINLINSSSSVTDKDIHSAEEALGFSIPKILKEMYIANNGGVLEYGKRIYQGESLELDIKHFLPVVHSKEVGIFTVEKLYTKLAIEKKLTPKNMLPFAIDRGGFPFCFCLDDGTIHFFDLESEQDIQLDDDFNHFVKNIISEEDAWG